METIYEQELRNWRGDSLRSLAQHRARKAARLTREYETRHNKPSKAISILLAASIPTLTVSFT